MEPVTSGSRSGSRNSGVSNVDQGALPYTTDATPGLHGTLWNDLTLSGANTYTGATLISGGTLQISGTGRLGSGTYAGANLAMLLVYNGLIKDDFAKITVMVASVFVFAFLGFEHSVANTVLFTIVGLQEGIALAPATINVIICLLGNYVGGGILIGLYFAYLNGEARYLRQHPELADPQGQP